MNFPGGSLVKIHLQRWRCGFSPWIRKNIMPRIVRWISVHPQRKIPFYSYCTIDFKNIYLAVTGLSFSVFACWVASVQFSHPEMSHSLWPHELQHARPPCPSSTPRVYSNSCPLSQWCHPTISSSVVPFSSSFQSFPASGSFKMSPFFTSGGQNTGISASASVLPLNIQDWFPLGWICWVSGTLESLLQCHSSKASILWHSAFFIVQLSHPYMTAGKTLPLARWTFVGKVMSLPFNMLSGLVITFLSRSKYLPSSSSMAAVTIWSDFGGP